jgi:hypothetical protein
LIITALNGAQIRDFSAKDQKFCIEVVASGRKGVKKYSFSTDSEGSRKRWLTALLKAAKTAETKPPAATADSAGEDTVMSPIANRAKASSGSASPASPRPKDDDDDDISVSSSGSTGSAQPSSIALNFLKGKAEPPPPPEKRGYLMKKSPRFMSGWQKRYFVLKHPGEIHYYDNVSFNIGIYSHLC